MATTYSQEDLDLLTEEERLAAQEAEDDTEEIEEEEETEETDKAKEVEGATGEEGAETEEAPGTEEAGGDGKVETEEAAQAAEAADDGAKTEEGAATDEEPDPFDSYEARPTPIWVAPEGADQRLTEIKERKKEIAKKFNDGEIELEEFNTATDALDEEKDTLRQQLDRAEMSQQMAQTEWLGGTVKAFLGMHPEYKAEAAFHALDAEVARLQLSGEFANPFDPKILLTAHRNVKGVAVALGGGVKEAETKPVAAKAPSPKPKVEAKPGKREIPPTLAKAPASDDALDDGGEFAALDRLADKDPIAFEKAMAKMSDAERDRYLAAS